MVLVIVGSTRSTGVTGLYKLNEDHSLDFVDILDVDGLEDSTNASWIHLASSGTAEYKFMFSTNETRGSIQLHKIASAGDDVTLRLQFSSPSGGSGTTHLALQNTEEAGTVLIASNYDSGSVSIFRLDFSELSLDGPVQLIDQNVPSSQSQSHAHQCVIHGNVAYVCDLGNNAVYTYSISRGPQPLCVIGELKLPAGCGPRHLAVGHGGSHAYILNELSSQVVVARIDPATSALVRVDGCDPPSSDMVSTLPTGASAADMAAAAILLSADGHFLYTSNRDVSSSAASNPSTDRSSISVFAVSSDGASVRLVQTVGSGGRHPRHMALMQTPTGGSVLLVANRDSQSFAVFPVNEQTGLLVEHRVVISSADPRCPDPGFVIQFE